MYKYEVRQIDAWMDLDGWTCNETWHIGEFTTKSENVKRAFIRFLNKNNIYFKKSRTLVNDESDYLEIIDRKTKEPLFIAIYNEQ